jgi:hypothetical protein
MRNSSLYLAGYLHLATFAAAATDISEEVLNE